MKPGRGKENIQEVREDESVRETHETGAKKLLRGGTGDVFGLKENLLVI